MLDTKVKSNKALNTKTPPVCNGEVYINCIKNNEGLNWQKVKYINQEKSTQMQYHHRNIIFMSNTFVHKKNNVINQEVSV